VSDLTPTIKTTQKAGKATQEARQWNLLGRAVVTGGLGLVVAGLSGLARRCRRVVVTGTSMAPQLLPGDRLLIVPAHRIGPGDVVALNDPRRLDRLIIKRVSAVDRSAGTITVLGDNAEASTDSRVFGPVPRRRVLGRAVYRYGPPERAGRMRRPVRSSWMAATALDGLLDAGFVEGLQTLPIEEIRVRRARATDVEVGLSYVRRLVQGRLDIVLAESRRRDLGEEPGDLASLVRSLPEILGEHVFAPGSGRLLTRLAPAEVDQSVLGELDAIVDADQLVSLPALGDIELGATIDALIALEREVSSKRRALHDVIDRLQEELVRRYKSGEATVDGLLR
jgi:nickel-type superoxide dismutase maturation protease